MPFTDNFTEASDTNLEDHTPSGGTDWALGAGAAGAAVVNAASNTLRSRTTTASYYTHDDQGSSNSYVQARLKTLVSGFADSYVATRLVDASNFIGWRCAGIGSTGLRLCSVVAGVVVDLVTFQGVDEAVYRVEVSGTTAKIFEDGVQKDTDQTVASSTETSQGIRIGSTSTNNWIDDYEAGALASGTDINGTPANATASGVAANINAETAVAGTAASSAAAGVAASLNVETAISTEEANATASGFSASVTVGSVETADTHDGGGWLQPVRRHKQTKEVRNELERLFKKAEIVVEQIAEPVEAKREARQPAKQTNTVDIGLPPLTELQMVLMHLRLIQDEMTGQQVARLAALQQEMERARMYNIRARAALLAA